MRSRGVSTNDELKYILAEILMYARRKNVRELNDEAPAVFSYFKEEVERSKYYLTIVK